MSSSTVHVSLSSPPRMRLGIAPGRSALHPSAAWWLGLLGFARRHLADSYEGILPSVANHLQERSGGLGAPELAFGPALLRAMFAALSRTPAARPVCTGGSPFDGPRTSW